MLAYGKTKIIYDDGYESEGYNDNLDLPDERPSDHFIRYHNVISLTNAIYELM